MTPQNIILTDLGLLPKARDFDEHVWVDYIELLCLVNIDRHLSKSDVLDQVRTEIDDMPRGLSDEVEIDSEDTDVNDTLDIRELQPAVENDKWSSKVSDWYRHLSFREKAFGKSYPFSLSSNGDVLRVKRQTTGDARCYVFLLLASNLRYCRSSIDPLTRSFEILSAEVLRNYLPLSAEVHIFGTSTRVDGRYRGSLWTKVNKLSQDLGEKIVASQGAISVNDNGDNGLDIVGWVPCGDSNTHRIVAFGQCACTPKWIEKQHSSGTEAWRRIMTLSVDINNFVFIPFCFRGVDGTWHRSVDITSILIDRLRFLHLMRGKFSIFKQQSAFGIVDTALKQRLNPFD